MDFLAKFFRNLNGNTKSARLVVTCVRWHTNTYTDVACNARNNYYSTTEQMTKKIMFFSIVAGALTLLILWGLLTFLSGDFALSVLPGWHTTISSPETSWRLISILLLLLTLFAYGLYRIISKVLRTFWTKGIKDWLTIAHSRQQYVCVMCFTAYLNDCASYRAFFVLHILDRLVVLARGHFIRLAQARLLLLQ